jgi:hypothetical protein
METKNYILKQHGKVIVPLLFATIFCAIGMYGIISGELSYRTAGKTAPFNDDNEIHLQGISCYFVSAAALTLGLSTIIYIISLYDKKENEIYYKRFFIAVRFIVITLYLAGVFGNWKD